MIAWSLLVSIAAASGEPWDDGLTAHVPRTAAVWLQGAYGPGPTRHVFGDVGGALPLIRNERGNLGVGVTVQAGATRWSVPIEDRGGVGMRSVGAEAWLWLGNPEKATTHAFGIGVGARPGDHASFLFNPVESANRLSLAYDGYVDGRRIDGSWQLRIGPNDRSLFEMTGHGAIIVEIEPRIAAMLGFHVGIAPVGHVVPGVRVRPLAHDAEAPVHLEIGLGAGVPIDIWEEEASYADRTALIVSVKAFPTR